MRRLFLRRVNLEGSEEEIIGDAGVDTGWDDVTDGLAVWVGAGGG